MPVQPYRSSAYNNAWANYRLLKACEQLDQKELIAKRSGFFPSILHTLNHILTVDWFYISALEGNCIGHSAFDPEIPCPLFSELASEQKAADHRLLVLCKKLTAEDLPKKTLLIHGKRLQHERIDRTLLHLFQHQIHHRGQVHAMLSETSVSPPQLDEFFLEDKSEKAAREDDFWALGFSEKEIWS
ncbi:DinB family protein [Kiloniella laminariae]|uniref:DinB family protein n=1 Tax=Kiloniella laminariae TaxID=454162 RepID=A0ABT4LEC6_9PROT|nr:DinB family protein [Kiloniella laminariae]MCZ4279452.1 DinB family protein [Kiloniella laminariae]